jgi:hypothetical protein
MPDYDKLLQASMPEALDAAIDTVNFVYQNAEQLLQANVTALDDLNYCVFAYLNRAEIFYLNQSGRRILSPYQSPIEHCPTTTKFGLESGSQAANDDRDVIESCRPKHHVRELISLAWGHTWLRGSKYPIRSNNGIPIAILFAGREMLGSEQIRNATRLNHNF